MTSADCTDPWEQTPGISSRLCYSKPSKHLTGTPQIHKLQSEMQGGKANLFCFPHTAKAAGPLGTLLQLRNFFPSSMKLGHDEDSTWKPALIKKAQPAHLAV